MQEQACLHASAVPANGQGTAGNTVIPLTAWPPAGHGHGEPKAARGWNAFAILQGKMKPYCD